jgi:hypothetical protein
MVTVLEVAAPILRNAQCIPYCMAPRRADIKPDGPSLVHTARHVLRSISCSIYSLAFIALIIGHHRRRSEDYVGVGARDKQNLIADSVG